jgi:hypothetical protein
MGLFVIFGKDSLNKIPIEKTPQVFTIRAGLVAGTSHLQWLNCGEEKPLWLFSSLTLFYSPR